MAAVEREEMRGAMLRVNSTGTEARGGERETLIERVKE